METWLQGGSQGGMQNAAPYGRGIDVRSRIGVRAILGGLVVALAIELVLMVLGAAVGISAFSPAQIGAQNAGAAARAVGVGAGLWLVASLCVSTFFGSWFASHAGRAPSREDGVLHGLVIWAAICLALVLSVGNALAGAISGALGFLENAPALMAPSSPASPSPSSPHARIEPNTGAGIGQGSAADRARSALGDAQTQRQIAEKTSEGLAIGLWGFLIAMLVPLPFALLGGAAGVGPFDKQGRSASEREVYAPGVSGTTTSTTTSTTRRREDNEPPRGPSSTPPIPTPT